MRSLDLRSLFASIVLACGALAAADAPVTASVAVPVGAESELAGFDYTIEDGLYATVTSMTCFKKPDVKDEKKIKLRDVLGFKKDMEVRAVLQDGPAPLAVIFLGLASKSKDPLARLWQPQLPEAGAHVLVFDSVFRPSFNQRSCHGVAGNVEMEAYLASNIIEAFLRHPDVHGKVTKVGLVGASYGGILALNFAKLAKAGKISLTPDRVLVFSPPVSMRVSATLLDKFYDEDRAKHGIVDLLKLKLHEPGPNKPNPFSPSLLRAGIGYVFRGDLEDAITCSKDLYDYKLPDAPKDGKGNEKDRRAFTRFIEQVVFPYWSKHGGVGSVEDLWEYGDLCKLALACSDNIHIVLTADDPLNDPTLVKYIRRELPGSKLTMLPRGGHLGFVGCRWSKDRIQQLFK